MKRRQTFWIVAGAWVVAFSIAWAYAMYKKMHLPPTTVIARTEPTVTLAQCDNRVGLTRTLAITVDGSCGNHFRIRSPLLVAPGDEWFTFSPANDGFSRIAEHHKWEVYENESKTGTLHWVSSQPYIWRAGEYRLTQRVGPIGKRDMKLGEMVFQVNTQQVLDLADGKAAVVSNQPDRTRLR